MCRVVLLRPSGYKVGEGLLVLPARTMGRVIRVIG
jgi:hypothetical protein